MILKGATTTTEPTQEDGDSEDEEDQEGYRGQGDPSFVKADNSEFHSTLMTVACGGEIPRGVLTYRNVTPSNQTRNGLSIYMYIQCHNAVIKIKNTSDVDIIDNLQTLHTQHVHTMWF